MSVPTFTSLRSPLKILLCSLIGFSSTLTLAASPSTVIQKASAVRQYLRVNAYSMDPWELDQIDRQLSNILSGNLDQYPGQGHGPGGGTDPYPYPGPGNQYPPTHYPPNPTPQPRSECKLLGRGDYANWTYSFRLSVNGQVMEANDSLDTILGKLTQYRHDGVCTTVARDALTLGARGDYANWTYSFRVLLAGTVISGTDNLETALGLITKIQSSGAGIVLNPNLPCQLLPRGDYANWTYSYRVGVGAEVMSGTDTYSTASATITRLRQAAVCY
jgi:hypothetical protein